MNEVSDPVRARPAIVRPRDAAVLNNRGVTLHKLRRFEEALASHDAALAIEHDHVKALTDRGVTLHDLKRFDEASASYDRAMALRPDHADAHFFKGLSTLVTGDFEHGWIEYEWRRSAGELRRKDAGRGTELPWPDWPGLARFRPLVARRADPAGGIAECGPRRAR